MRKPRRIRLKEPPRSGPIRSFSGLLGKPGAINGARTNGTRAPAGGDAIVEGVKRAYEVIDRYVNEGRQATERLAGSTNLGANPRASGNLQSLFEQMMRRQTELLPLWLELFAAVAVVERPQVTPSSASKVEPRRPGAVAIEVSWRPPAQVQVDLPERLVTDTLTVPCLNAIQDGHPPITDIAFGSESGVDVLRIKVPDDQPPGVYAGVIVDRKTGNPCGSVTVRIRQG